MFKEIKGIKNVVLIANSFNPSVFSQSWLINNQILDEKEFKPQSIFSEQIVQVVTDDLTLLVLPDQLQINANNDEISFENITSKLETIVTKLPFIPYKKMGINFIHYISSLDKDGNDLTKKYFYNSQQPLYSLFSSVDSRSGICLSKNSSLGSRLKLDIKPVDLRDSKKAIQFSFNYHFELNDNPQNKIIEALGSWNLFYEETKKMVEAVK